MSNTGDTVIAQGSFVSFITNGIRINHTTVDGSAYFVTVWMVSGISAWTDKVSLTTLNTATTVTGVTFRPTDLIVSSICRTMDGTITNGDATASFGLVHDAAGTVTQRAHGHIDVDPGAGVSPMQQAGRVTTSYGAMKSSTAGAVTWGANFSAFGADGFTVTPNVANANCDIGVIALKFDNSSVLTTTLPNATGNNSVTTVGFEPVSVLEMISVYTAVNASNAATTGSITLSAVTANTQICTGWGGRDNVATTRTRSVSDNQAILVKSASDDTTLYSATHVSFDSGGWTRNFATVLAATRVGFALAIGAQNPVASATSVSGMFGSFQWFGRLG